MPYKNKEDQNKYNAVRLKRNRQILNKLKSKPCIDCGGIFPFYVMQFDHVPERGKKKKCVSHFAGDRSINAVTFQNEIKKCDIICANCHCIRTYQRGQNTRRRIA